MQVMRRFSRTTELTTLSGSSYIPYVVTWCHPIVVAWLCILVFAHPLFCMAFNSPRSSCALKPICLFLWIMLTFWPPESYCIHGAWRELCSLYSQRIQPTWREKGDEGRLCWSLWRHTSLYYDPHVYHAGIVGYEHLVRPSFIADLL